MKNIVMMIGFAGLFAVKLQAQDSTKNTDALLNGKHYTFQPINMNPASGRLRQVDIGYLLQIKGDSLIAYLPYFGRAYSAPIKTNDAGINFTSTNFSYVVSKGRKDSYFVTIVTKDRTYNTTFLLTAYNSGTAYLQVNNNDKQTISYNGSIKK